ncbi:hypothetical protein QE367_002222 [Microbacterium paludicola]|uniref:Uncharacterized protein n=1 Tax=Microbacterium paludicola TaxID=300019 RepID=A0ABU1I4E0_9MICO|nr:hypothetical protein [Microbacterium paludicola]
MSTARLTMPSGREGVSGALSAGGTGAASFVLLAG